MPELTHKLAVYYDGKNKRQVISSLELLDDIIFAKSKTLELYDVTEQFRVDTRTREGTRHFYVIGEKIGGRVVYSGEDDPAHNELVEKILEKLKREDGYTLCIDVSQAYEPENLNTLYKLSGYSWGAEVHRIMSAAIFLRHDIFGQDSSNLGMSVMRPSVAIEVINTHFPEQVTFQAMIDESKRTPALVLFEFVGSPGSFLKIDRVNKKIILTKWAFYICDGMLYHKGRAMENCSAALFEATAKILLNRWAKK